MTQSKPLTTPRTETSDGNDERLAHIVTKDEQMRGYVGGEPIKALCGKVWVPSRDYQGLPVCEVCVAERERRMAGRRRLN
ncbi:MAG TPA: DUF3039 domain-containing protein [Acidimicrobiia bacterium]